MTKDNKSKRTVERFIHRFDQSYQLLAYYAALPMILTPELLNYLYTKFLRGRVPWEAQADLLLSDLCEQVGYEMYTMEPALREYLLNEMEKHEGIDNMQKVAYLLLSYVQHASHTDSVLSERELQAQRWAAMAYIEDERKNLGKEIAKSLQTHNQTEKSWLLHIIQTLEPQLKELYLAR